MKNFKAPIIFNTDKSFENIHLYIASDMHKGSAEFSDSRWKAFEKLLEPPNAFVMFVGDQHEFATRSSKSDVYTQKLSPHEQKEWWIMHMREYKDKIVSIIDGNHEFNRASRDADMFPLYDIALALGIEDRYRSEACFVDIGVGQSKPTESKQVRYVGYSVHKAQNLANFGTADALDGIDFFVSGHTHKPMDKPLGKLVYDTKNKKVTHKSVENIVSGSFLDYGGYGTRGGFRPTSQKLYKLVLSGKTKKIETVGFYV